VGIPLGILGLAVYGATVRGFDPARLFRDPVSAGSLPIYTGLISSLGVVLWVATAGICLFAYSLVRTRAGQAEGARFLLAIGLLTALLGLDDLLLFHEQIAPRLLRIPELMVMVGYATFLGGIFIRFRRVLLDSADELLAGALMGLGGSVAFDVLAPPGGMYPVAEDGLKFLGIALWSTFHVRVAFRLLQPNSSHDFG